MGRPLQKLRYATLPANRKRLTVRMLRMLYDKACRRQKVKFLDKEKASFIFSEINRALGEKLVETGSVRIPYLNTIIGVKMLDIKGNRTVNMHDTLKLWDEDEEARREKRCIYFDTKLLFEIITRNCRNTIGNKYTLMRFRLSRDLYVRIIKAIEEGKII